MKWKLFTWIFKNELQACEDVIEKCDNRIRRSISETNHQFELLKKQYDLCHRIFSIDTGAEIIGMETNKNNEELFIIKSICRSSLTIKLYGNSYQGISGLPRIMATINEKYEEKDRFIYCNHDIHIDDILMTDDDIGNGSIAMKYFLKVIDELNEIYKMNVKYIDGFLSSMDKDHFDRLEHYYKKFGFEVTFNEDRTSGRILMKLS